MTTLHSGADTAGFLAPASGGPIRTGRSLYRCVAIITTIMMLIGGFAFIPSVVRADAGTGTGSTQVTADLNLREEPALNAEIIDVITEGSSLDITGDPANGFYPVSYQGQSGYAYGHYLNGAGAVDGPVTTDGQSGEVNVADGPVNFRTGPSEADGVISVIPDGALVALTGNSANGYLSIIYTDQSGWAYGPSVLGTEEAPPQPAEQEEPVAPSDPVEAAPTMPENVPVEGAVIGSATVVDGRLSLRSGPSTDYSVITMMPDGAPVELRGEPQGNFYPVSFNGTIGWASADFLQVGGEEPQAPTQPEEPTPTDPPAPKATEPPAQPEEPLATEPPAPDPTEEPTQPEEPAMPSVDGSDGYSEDEIIQIIYAAADAYGQPREDMLRVARCESNLTPTAVNASSNASGLFQFLPSTWATTPYADEDIFDPVASANAAAWMWDNGRRNEWVCQ